MRGVESTPPGDLPWAVHCTRQQALLLIHALGHPRIPTLDQLAEALDIPIGVNTGLPTPSAALHYSDGSVVLLVSGELTASEQLRAAVVAVKHHLDLPQRLSPGANGFSEAEYEAVAQTFGDMVLGPMADNP